MSDDFFRMLADPTRRRILDYVLEHADCTVGEIAEQFPDLVASGISKHLMALRAAGLVVSTRDGRHRRYHINGPEFSRLLEPWLARYEQYWAGSLEALRDLAESEGANGEGEQQH